MSDAQKNPYRVSIGELEHGTQVPAEELVTELGEDPNEGPVTEERRRIEELLRWGTERGA